MDTSNKEQSWKKQVRSDRKKDLNWFKAFWMKSRPEVVKKCVENGASDQEAEKLADGMYLKLLSDFKKEREALFLKNLSKEVENAANQQIIDHKPPVPKVVEVEATEMSRPVDANEGDVGVERVPTPPVVDEVATSLNEDGLPTRSEIETSQSSMDSRQGAIERMSLSPRQPKITSFFIPTGSQTGSDLAIKKMYDEAPSELSIGLDTHDSDDDLRHHVPIYDKGMRLLDRSMEIGGEEREAREERRAERVKLWAQIREIREKKKGSRLKRETSSQPSSKPVSAASLSEGCRVFRPELISPFAEGPKAKTPRDRIGNEDDVVAEGAPTPPVPGEVSPLLNVYIPTLPKTKASQSSMDSRKSRVESEDLLLRQLKITALSQATGSQESSEPFRKFMDKTPSRRSRGLDDHHGTPRYEMRLPSLLPEPPAKGRTESFKSVEEFLAIRDEYLVKRKECVAEMRKDWAKREEYLAKTREFAAKKTQYEVEMSQDSEKRNEFLLKISELKAKKKGCLRRILERMVKRADKLSSKRVSAALLQEGASSKEFRPVPLSHFSRTKAKSSRDRIENEEGNCDESLPEKRARIKKQ